MPRTFLRSAPPVEKWRQVTLAAVDKVLELRALNTGETLHGPRWIAGMVSYYGNRARQLLSQAPKGQQAWARKQRERLDQE